METVKVKISKTAAKIIARLREGVLRDTALMLLENGLRLMVYKPDDKSTVTWFYFELDGKLGYCQIDGGFGDRVRFSTVHKPNAKIGTGYGLQQPYEGLMSPTLDDAFKAFALKPSWAGRGINVHDPMPVKYNGIEDYLKSPVNQILKYDII